MLRRPAFILAAILVPASAVLAGCGARFVESPILADDLRVRNDWEHREIVDVLERYQVAVEDLDIPAIADLISRDYYENAGTTDTTEDDYGYAGVSEMFQTLADHVRDVRVELVVRDVQVEGDEAYALCEYGLTMLYEVGGEERWETSRDVNRIEFQLEGSAWRIVAGL